MGYRSDVYLKTTKAGYKALEQEIKKNELGYKLWKDPDKVFYDDIEETITVEWDDVKWYSGYEDVRTIENAIGAVCDKYTMHFVRIGESYDDLEDEFYDGEDEEMFDPIPIHRYAEPCGEKVDLEELFNE